MKNIGIHDFRCFHQLWVDFAPGVNLLIGDNASGKTSFLLACKYAVNCFFSGFSDQFTHWSSPKTDDFLRLNIGEKRFGTFPILIEFSYFKSELDDAKNFELHTDLQTLICKSEKNRKPLLSGLKNLRDYGKFLLISAFDVKAVKEQDAQVVALPLIASYSTHGIHKNQKVNSNYFKEINQTPSFGYYLCGSTDGLLEYWIKRMLILVEAGKNFTEQNVVLTALMDMFGEEGCDVIIGFDVRINYKDIICIFKDGRETPVSILSDGYRRLVSVVMDIAFRCALLNGLKYGEDAAKMTKGTVIIDEIDLHLHPSLQSIVLKALQHTFPNIQFIVSTHAPMVMSGVESDGRNCVMRMVYDPEEKEYFVNRVDTYGMDLSTLAETVLNVPSRNPAVKEQLDSLAEHIDNEEYVAAKELLSHLKEQFGDRLPELSGFDTQISIEEALQ